MTVGELKQRMTSAELAAWVLYVEEMGPLNLAWRIDFAVARAVTATIGGKDTIDKMMPYPKRQSEDDREGSVEELMSILSAAKSNIPAPPLKVVVQEAASG